MLLGTVPFNENLPVNFARAMPNWQPLVEYRRNGVAENTIHGAVSWVSGRNVIYSFGGNVEVYGRSMVKPVMMKVFRREFATALSGEQQAISVASHNGDTEHVRVARSILLQGEWGLMQAPLDVIDRVRPGSIILLHPWYGNAGVRAAIPKIIAGVKARGFQFVTVDELLRMRRA